MMEKRWPLHPRPYPNESLLSWVTRIASLYNLNPEQFLQYECGLTLDHDHLYELDLNPPMAVLYTLSERTGIEFDCVYKLTAQSYVPLLIDTFNSDATNLEDDYLTQFSIFSAQKPPIHPRYSNGWRPWFDIKRFAVIHGCEVCLREGPEPYIRLHWRFPWMMSCPIHQVLLKQVMFYGLISETLRFFFMDSDDLVVPQAPDPLYFMDTLTLQAVTTGAVDTPGGRIHGGVWLRLLRTLIEELNMPISMMDRKAGALIIPFWQERKLDVPKGLDKFKIFECLHPKKQLMLMLVASSVLNSIFSNQAKFSNATIKHLAPPLFYEDF